MNDFLLVVHCSATPNAAALALFASPQASPFQVHLPRGGLVQQAVGSGTGAVARQDTGLAVSGVSPFVPV